MNSIIRRAKSLSHKLLNRKLLSHNRYGLKATSWKIYAVDIQTFYEFGMVVNTRSRGSLRTQRAAEAAYTTMSLEVGMRYL